MEHSRALLELCCALHGRQLVHLRTTVREKTLAVDNFVVQIKENDVVLYDRIGKTSYSFLDLGSLNVVGLFHRLFHGTQEILHRYQYIPPIPRFGTSRGFPRIDVVSLVLIASSVLGNVTRISSDIHRTRCRFWVQPYPPKDDGFRWRYSLEFTGTLATARCLSCRRIRRAPLLRVRVRKGQVLHGEDLILFFYNFVQKHFHVISARCPEDPPSASS